MEGRACVRCTRCWRRWKVTWTRCVERPSSRAVHRRTATAQTSEFRGSTTSFTRGSRRSAASVCRVYWWFSTKTSESKDAENGWRPKPLCPLNVVYWNIVNIETVKRYFWFVYRTKAQCEPPPSPLNCALQILSLTNTLTYWLTGWLTYSDLTYLLTYFPT